MGPCQGKYCHVSIRITAKNRTDEAAIGTTTGDRRGCPSTMGLLGGRDLAPVRRTSLHHRHEEAGGDDLGRRVEAAALLR